MKAIVSEGTPPQLGVEEFWPVSGPPWSNLSHEHRVQADGSDWDRITPNGSTLDKPPRSPKAGDRATMIRRAALQNTVSWGMVGDKQMELISDAIEKFEGAASDFEELPWGKLTLASISQLVDEAKERRQVLVTKRVVMLNKELRREPATLGVLMVGLGNKLMAQLGGFFVQYVESDNGDLQPQPGITLISRNDEPAQIPQDYEANGLYLRTT